MFVSGLDIFHGAVPHPREPLRHPEPPLRRILHVHRSVRPGGFILCRSLHRHQEDPRVPEHKRVGQDEHLQAANKKRPRPGNEKGFCWVDKSTGHPAFLRLWIEERRTWSCHRACGLWKGTKKYSAGHNYEDSCELLDYFFSVAWVDVIAQS